MSQNDSKPYRQFTHFARAYLPYLLPCMFCPKLLPPRTVWFVLLFVQSNFIPRGLRRATSLERAKLACKWKQQFIPTKFCTDEKYRVPTYRMSPTYVCTYVTLTWHLPSILWISYGNGIGMTLRHDLWCTRTRCRRGRLIRRTKKPSARWAFCWLWRNCCG